MQTEPRSYIVKIRMDTDTRYKNRIGQRLTEILLTSYAEGELTENQIPFIARVIREELAEAKTSSEVFALIEELAAEWPVFKSVLAEPKERIVKNVNRRWLEQLTMR